MKLNSLLMATGGVTLLLVGAANAAEHQVKMLNKGAAGTNVYEPAVLKIAPGDTVKFVNADKGHNSETIPGMVPEGGKSWKGKINEEVSVTLDKEGVYGYKCLPHYGLGMVGVIVVGNAAPNLEQAKKVKHPGKVAQIFEGLLAEAAK